MSEGLFSLRQTMIKITAFAALHKNNNMKKLIAAIVAITISISLSDASAQFKIGGKSVDAGKLIKASSNVATAVKLSDDDVARLCRESVEWMDAHNPIADDTTEYCARLKRLTANIKEVNGIPLNFKVYHVTDINAFACADGSVRVFSSLMDIMDDDELMGVIGHEIGHVAGGHSKAAMKTAYLSSAAVEAAGAAGGVAQQLSESAIADLAVKLTNAQFSQKQESEADEYGFQFAVANGFDPYGPSNALKKLSGMSGGAKASALQKMFSSHPDSQKRSARLKEMADEYTAKTR